MDPHFMANLAKLGAVKVPRNKLNYKPVSVSNCYKSRPPKAYTPHLLTSQNDQMLSILRARDRETQASSASSDFSAAASQANRLSAPTLVALLDARKSCRTAKDVEELAHGYDIDVSVIEELARFVNSPSISARARPAERVTVDNEEEVSDACAAWVRIGSADTGLMLHDRVRRLLMPFGQSQRSAWEAFVSLCLVEPSLLILKC